MNDDPRINPPPVPKRLNWTLILTLLIGWSLWVAAAVVAWWRMRG